MASAGIDFSGLTPKNGAVAKLSELIFLEAIEDESILNKIMTFVPGIEGGKKIGFVQPKGLFGKASQGCKPTYDTDMMTTSEKAWDPKEWQIAEQLCYADLEGTIAEKFPKNGSDVADLTDEEYLNQIVEPALQNAIVKLIIRLTWFGDTEIAGNLKEAENAQYFNLIDGFFKQIFEGVAAGKTKRYTIAANEAATIDAQYSAMLQPGVATGVLDNIILRTPAKVLNQEGRSFFVTGAFAKALENDIQKNNKGSALQWESIFEGVRATKYNSIPLVAIDNWDEIIQEYLKNTTNENAYDKPFRVVFGSLLNFRAGSKSQDRLAQLRVMFIEDEQVNKILAKDTLDAKVVAEEYVVAAY